LRRWISLRPQAQAAGGDDEGLARARKGRGDGLDRELVSIGVSGKVREVMNEGGVDDAIHGRCSALQAVKVLERPPMHRRPCCSKRLRAFIGTREPKHLMARAQQLLNDSRPNKPRSSGNENTPVVALLVDEDSSRRV